MRFIPAPLDWTIHPLCVALRRADPAHPDRWQHLIRRAHLEGRGGKLLLYDDTPIDAEQLAHDHDRDVDGWKRFVAICVELGLLAWHDGVLVVAVWKFWHRSSSEMPEAIQLRAAESRERKLAGQVAALESDLARIKAKGRRPESEDQLRLPETEAGTDPARSSDARTDRGAEDNRPSGTGTDSVSQDSDARTNRDAEVNQPTANAKRAITDRNGRERAETAQNDNRSTCRPTCKSRESTHADHGGDRAMVTRSERLEHGVVSFDKNVSFIGSAGTEAFWTRVERLFQRTSKRKWEYGRRKLETELAKPWATGGDPAAWWWTIASAVQEVQEQMKGGKKVTCPWALAMSLCEAYADHGAKVAWQKARGETGHFVRLSELRAV